MREPQFWFSVITAVVAIYGAGVSTYMLVEKRRESKFDLVVSGSFGFLTGPRGLSAQMIIITVANRGQRGVIVNAPALRLPNGRTLVSIYPTGDVTFA
ncbi:MAG TPA: hypothetical protein VG713_03970, partial [Pirellulales bacterium]|nr:hypothetical protein [Pirellulales bacterium]